ncbi:MAG: hypothetical protein DMG00_14470 [Acidobacteria bacterium]|nr:MAG: hypothetical protein DMG00_14470 [Acidobacteriota bacterium]
MFERADGPEKKECEIGRTLHPNSGLRNRFSRASIGPPPRPRFLGSRIRRTAYRPASRSIYNSAVSFLRQLDVASPRIAPTGTKVTF